MRHVHGGERSLIARVWWVLCTLVVSCTFGTETGNPPVIDAMLLHFRATAGELAVEGDAGAVKPGGSVVELVELPSQNVLAAVESGDNGAFVLRARGAVQGQVVVRARHEGQASADVPFPSSVAGKSPPTPGPTASDDESAKGANVPDAQPPGAPLTPEAGPVPPAASDAGAAVSGDAGATSTAPNGPATLLSCGELTAAEESRIDETLSNVVGPCVSSADCEIVDPSSSCRRRCTMAITRTGRDALEASLRDIEQTLCAPYRAAGCTRELDECEGVEMGPIECREGQCVRIPFLGPTITDVDRN